MTSPQYLFNISPFRSILGDEIVLYTPKDMMAILGISRSSLDRYRDEIIRKKPPGFRWYFYSKGYDKQSAECLWTYAKIVNILGIPRANAKICDFMAEYWKLDEKLKDQLQAQEMLVN